MLIDSSYFTSGPRHILNASMGNLPNANAIEVCKAIDAYIESYQFSFLTDMLGHELAHELNSYILSDDFGTVKESVEPLDEVCERLKEPFADFVFFHILADSNTQATTTGLVRLKCANQYVAPIRRQVIVWNTMVERNRLFHDWIKGFKGILTPVHVSDNMLTRINPFNL